MSGGWALCGLPVALVALPGVVGLFVGPTFVASAEVTVPRPIDEVRAAIRDPSRFPLTRPRQPPEIAPDGTWREFPAGTGTAFRVRTVEDAPDRLVRAFRDEVAPVEGEITTELASAGPGTRIVVTERIRIGAGGIRGPYFRFVMWTVGRGAGARSHVAALAAGLA